MPSVSAPPAAATLWHMAQLMRKSSAPLAGSPFPSRYWPSGMAGPGASEATYAASSFTCVSVNCVGFSGAWTVVPWSGMRPEPTWKSTEAAPTPMRLGATPVPVASMPWQVAQLEPKSFWPSSMVCADLRSTSADAVPDWIIA